MTPSDEAVPDGLAVRRIEPSDTAACADVFYAAQDELYARKAVPLLPRNAASLSRYIEGMLESDPDRAWLAERRGPGDDAGRVIAFGCAVRRDTLRFLSFLFVHPDEQAAGVGRHLLLRCLPELTSRDAGDVASHEVLATCVDSVQPVSTALYAGYGLVPRVPLFTLVGDPRPGVLGDLPSSVTGQPFAEVARDAEGHGALVDAISELDRDVVGFERPRDHRAWRLAGRDGVLYRAAGSPGAIAYGYVQPTGRIGPVAVRDASLLPGVLADLVGRVRPTGSWQVHVPGDASHALVPLLAAGLRLDGQPGIYCATRRTLDFERYIPASFALP